MKWILTGNREALLILLSVTVKAIMEKFMLSVRDVSEIFIAKWHDT